jgi:hypothetical protein
MAVDDEPLSPEFGHLMGALRRVEPGKYRIKGVAGEAATTAALELSEPNLIRTNKHAFWCAIVARRQNGELVIVSPSPSQCGGLIKDLLNGMTGK